MSAEYRCPHGLDLRKFARCYLCEPEPRPLVMPGSIPPWAAPLIRDPNCTCPDLKDDEVYTVGVFCSVHTMSLGTTGNTPTGWIDS